MGLYPCGFCYILSVVKSSHYSLQQSNNHCSGKLKVFFSSIGSSLRGDDITYVLYFTASVCNF